MGDRINNLTIQDTPYCSSPDLEPSSVYGTPSESEYQSPLSLC
jgi:hypothetical protein